jgi:hypothetical protein
LTDLAGTFSFGEAPAPAAAIKAVDAGPVHGRSCLFQATLSALESAVTVTDVETGAAVDFTHPAGGVRSRRDCDGLPPLPEGPVPGASVPLPPPRDSGEEGSAAVAACFAPAACGPGSAALCLGGGRFRATVSWRLPGHGHGMGTALPLGDDAGAFSFLDDEDLEVIVRLDPQGARWRLVYGSLTSTRYTLTVVDTRTGTRHLFTNPAGRTTGGETLLPRR